jgi:hypothetical protein
MYKSSFISIISIKKSQKVVNPGLLSLSLQRINIPNNNIVISYKNRMKEQPVICPAEGGLVSLKCVSSCSVSVSTPFLQNPNQKPEPKDEDKGDVGAASLNIMREEKI